MDHANPLLAGEGQRRGSRVAVLFCPLVYTDGAMRVLRPRVLGWQWTIAGFLVLVGFLLVSQFRVGRTIRREVELPTVRVRDLAVLVQQQADALKALQAEVDQLRQKLTAYDTAAAQGRVSAQTLASEVEFYRMVLGLTSVRGPGVVVRLREQSVPGGVLAPAVQPQDLSGLANELWSAGAEAIAINGVRLLATTGLRQDERGILAGIFRIQAPYQIQAIGNAQAMTATLNLRGGFVEGLRSVGLAVEVVQKDALTLAPFRGPLQFRFATPVQP